MISLYTAATPNGYKISIMMEELNIPYQVIPLDLGKLQQKEESYLKINPNGRIPAIVDHQANDFAVFESGAILIYLAEKFQRFLPNDIIDRSKVLQWLMFQMAGVGPMMGQANVFFRYFPEKIPAAIDRYQNEVKRLFSVLDTHLAQQQYLAGDYSIADIATFPWINTHSWSGVAINEYSNLIRWKNLIGSRPAVQRGLNIPKPMLKEESKESTDKFIMNAQKMLQK